MNPSNLFSEIRNSKCAAFVFEKSPGGANRFRDRVIFYYDGKARFERYCMGEAAGKVCELSADSLDERGAIAWNYDDCSYSKKEEAPKVLTGAGRGGLVFDGKVSLWQKHSELKNDPDHGYGFFKMLWWRLFKK